jgi:hypothetical protein
MSHYEDLNTTKIALAGFISTVGVFALILLMMVLFHREMAEQTQLKVVDQPAVEYDTLTADQRAKLASYRWLDPEKKIVQIPIKQAMGLVLEELQQPPAEKSSRESPPANNPEAKEGDHGS